MRGQSLSRNSNAGTLAQSGGPLISAVRGAAYLEETDLTTLLEEGLKKTIPFHRTSQRLPKIATCRRLTCASGGTHGRILVVYHLSSNLHV